MGKVGYAIHVYETVARTSDTGVNTSPNHDSPLQTGEAKNIGLFCIVSEKLV